MRYFAFFLCLLLPLSSVAAEPEAERGCSDEEKDSPKGAADLFCNRYMTLEKWYGAEFDKTPNLRQQLNTCKDFAMAVARVRNVACAYYRESVAFAEYSEQFKSASDGQRDTSVEHQQLAAQAKKIHEKYRALFSGHRGTLLTSYLAVVDALKAGRQRYFAQTQAEAMSCGKSSEPFSKIPGLYLEGAAFFLEHQSRELNDRFQKVGSDGLKHALSETLALGKVEGLDLSRAKAIGASPDGKRAPDLSHLPNVAVEWAWFGVADQAGQALEKHVIHKLSYLQTVARFGQKYPVPFGSLIGLGIDYARHGYLDANAIAIAICAALPGPVGVVFGLLCITKGALIAASMEAREQYQKFGAYYFENVNSRVGSKELSEAFCKEREKQDKDQVAKSARERTEAAAQRKADAEKFQRSLETRAQETDRFYQQSLQRGRERQEISKAPKEDQPRLKAEWMKKWFPNGP